MVQSGVVCFLRLQLVLSQVLFGLATVYLGYDLTFSAIRFFETGNSGFLSFFRGSIPLKVQIDDATV